jgi:hypothetical protein
MATPFTTPETSRTVTRIVATPSAFTFTVFHETISFITMVMGTVALRVGASSGTLAR